jgi:hypothetical protein
MQLKKPKSDVLAAAALTLLGGVGSARAADEPRWVFDTAALLYAEGGGRVRAFEPKLNATHGFADQYQLGAGLTVDVLTGASPNGAAPASAPQTFTSPSGNSTFTTGPGEVPLDPSFKDTRFAVDLGFDAPLGSRNTVGVHASGSTEYDYKSFGGGAAVSHSFNLNDTTLSAGLNYASDTINPVGGTPTPLAIKTGAGGGPDQSKQVIDGLFGVTQVLSPVSVGQLSYSLSYSSGYLTDPYKIVSVVAPNAAPVRYLFESRPDTRLKHSLYLQYKSFLWDRDVVDVSYRFMTDDWGVLSHTLDSTFRWNFGDAKYVEPHLRWYRQGAADFYVAALDDGQSVTYASGDPRLGAFDGVTLGLKYGQTLSGGSQWSARLEYYKQIGRTEGLPPKAGASLSQFDLAPALDALMLTFGYRISY